MSSLKAQPKNLEEKLDAIVLHLEHLDRRDRIRTIGGVFRGILALIPLVLLLWSSWYFAENSDEIMKKISDAAASSAAKYALPLR